MVLALSVRLLLFFTIIASFLAIPTTFVSSALHLDELNVLEKIATTLGIKGLNLSYGDPCSSRTLNIMQGPTSNSENINNTIGCNCSIYNNMTCHITSISLKALSLSGKLPRELANLRYLQSM
ncbi:putative LRR receptor-like serine/threonine-protein kinase [Raphanus sativus]|uniref:Probable LRR receptor-like serine/threonine-protein kinase At1g29720 n=1 Tax=Raphanus sativus TaxID=3726 RepID=A0A9W3CV53_RAPSA|nr:probable LRR receptor-like serine/threonine-protein kinase At1g29720 [Raphanus sativus]KAJ4868728.1 putative LRR receptor-like serine/threonine-protein kinase [Raphanus sativus]